MNEEFTSELTTLINRHSMENGSHTPDFLLAMYLTECLNAWNKATQAREQWYGRGRSGAVPADHPPQPDSDRSTPETAGHS